jgi:fumarate reductase subunit C
MLKERVLREAKNFALIFFYLWVILGLFSLHKSLILGQDYLFSQGIALLNALVLAKIMLTLEIFARGRNLAAEAAPRAKEGRGPFCSTVAMRNLTRS